MRRLALLLAAAALAAAALASPAHAAFGLSSFDVTFSGAGGGALAQAGAHPEAMTTSFTVNTKPAGEGVLPDGAVKDLLLFQVPGFIGDQTAVPRCSNLNFLERVLPHLPNCPNSSAIGLAHVTVGTDEDKGTFISPFYNLEPSPGQVAKLGFFVRSVPVTVDVGLSPTPPYNLIATSRNISQVLEFYGGEFEIWGVPAASAHDALRGSCVDAEGKSAGECPAGVSPRPFLALPRACEGPLASEYEMDSWQSPGAWVGGFALSHDDAVPPNPQGMIGCGKLGFGPRAAAQPTTSEAESAAGLDIAIDVSDEGLKNPEGIAQADIAAIITRFPAGITANPSAAEGLGVCSEAQFAAEALATAPGGGCPGASKLGSVEALTPLLEDHPLHGSLYLAAQGAGNPFGSLLAFYLVVRDPELGIFVKLAGRVDTDPRSGRLVSSFEDLPPFPLSHVGVHLRSGPRAPLITPPTCATYTTEMELIPSSGAPPLRSDSSFQITSGPGGAPCPPAGAPPFAPGFEAGSASNAAGRFAPFSMRITRADGEQDITRFSAALPPGVTGKIAGLARCPDEALGAAAERSGRAELAAPSCPAASQVGRVVAGAGVGNALTYVPGSLYLAGPYKSAPLSVAAIVPAVAGPFDLGTVITRVGLRLNPDTGEVEVDGAASDPIPHILEGIPLKVRDLRVFADRPGFTLNPTSCGQSATRAEIFGSFADPFDPADDVALARASRYQAASCASLQFKPKLSLALGGGTKRAANTALHATLTARPGDANVKDAVVTLPPSQFIDNAHINNPCTRVQFNAGACPPSSVLGTAKAITPLLDQPLQGPVYFRSNGGERLLPDVVADLGGELHFTLVIAILKSRKGRVTTRVLNAPDAPVTRFELKLAGGKKGLLQNSENLCSRKQRAVLNLAGQNGARHKTRPLVSTSCHKKAGKGKKRSAPHRRG